jgi:hypothetical protein
MKPRDGLGLAALLVLIVLGLFLAWQQGDRFAQRPLGDFAEYWAAGTLAVRGENPYDKDRVAELEREAGRTGEPVLMYNPPWALTLVLPLGLLDVRTAQTAWQLAHLLALALTAHLLGQIYAGPGQRAAGWLATFTFLPCYVALAMGQIAPLMPLAVALFLLAVEHDRDFLAGLACAVLSIKPQAGLLFWPVLALWVLQTRRWAVLAGLAAGIAAGLAVPLALNPAVVAQYREMTRLHPPTQYQSPTWGAALRLVFGVGHFWLQFLPPLVGLAWALGYWLCRRRAWNWPERLPLVLLVSLCTMAYGWFYDLVLALPAVVQMAGRPPVPRLALAGYAAVNAVALVQTAGGAHGFWFIWAAPALLVLYLLGRRDDQKVAKVE